MKNRNILILLIILTHFTIYAQKTKFNPYKIEAKYFSNQKNDKAFTEEDGNTYKIKVSGNSRTLLIRHNKQWEKHGVYYEMYSNGSVKKKYSYKYGEKEGEAIHYFTNGKIISEVTYKNNLKEGKYYYYRNNEKDTLIEVTNYKKGQKEGTKYVYWADGTTKKLEQEYKDNKRNGSSCNYDTKGKLTNCSEFVNGKKIKS